MRYDAFVSFSMETPDKKKTKDFFYAKRIARCLEELLGISTFFSEKSLLERSTRDFQKEIVSVIKGVKALVLVVLDVGDYLRKEYFKSEREAYLRSHTREKRTIYVLTVKSIMKDMSPFSDIVPKRNLKGRRRRDNQPEFFDIESSSDLARFLNMANNDLRGRSKKVDDIKICKKCLRVFHDSNEIGSLCSHHDPSSLTREKGRVSFSCCNKSIRIDEDNELVDLSPGCLLSSTHEF